jgi:hypothetical protein
LVWATSRTKAVKELLARNVYELDDEAEVFLVDRLQIPRSWILEAKVRREFFFFLKFMWN